jgi:hypothetical protein
MTRIRIALLSAALVLVAFTTTATAAASEPFASTASPTGGGIAFGAGEYQGFGTESIHLLAQGTPAAATGRLVYRRAAPGFDANAAGRITCFLQVGNRGYFSGTFFHPFLSGPTEIRFFNGVVVDASLDGSADEAFVMLGADAPIPCDDPGTMAFLDSMSTRITRGNFVVRSLTHLPVS